MNLKTAYSEDCVSTKSSGPTICIGKILDHQHGLEYSFCKQDQTISVWPAFGFPNIVEHDGDWEDTWFYCNICEGQIPVYNLESDILPETDLKIFGDIDKWATEEFIQQRYHRTSIDMIRDWETKAVSTQTLRYTCNTY